jgi:hypothetical protein
MPRRHPRIAGSRRSTPTVVPAVGVVAGRTIERAHGMDGDRVRTEFTVTREDLDTFTRWQILRSRVVRRLALLFGFTVLCGVIAAVTFDGVLGIILIVIGCVEAVVYSALFASTPRRVWAKRSADMRSTQIIEFSEAGVFSQTVNAESDARWSIFTTAVEHQDLYFLGFAGARLWRIVPKRAFASPGDEARFRQLVGDHTDARLS